ncbi:MAG TPA: neutral zinc metallopeptidase, partial [Phycicoccus sp.]
MSFNDNVQLDTSQVRSGGGGGGGAPGGLVVGGGIGGLIILVIAMIFGINPSDIPTGGTTPADQGQVQPGGQQDGAAFAQCKSGADANASVECRVIGTVNSVQAFWTDELVRYKRQWQPTQTVLYSGTEQSACGTASNQV